ncbi:hypothetical protein CE195_12485, partial [Sodalis-like symbiont of Philaenus spumarius]
FLPEPISQRRLYTLFCQQALALTAFACSYHGARYSDGQYSFWSKDERSFIERQDKIIVDDCVIQSATGK